MKISRLFTSVTILTAIALSTAWGNPQTNRHGANSNSFNWRNLQSDIPGVARHVDPNLINPWGMALASSGNLWVNDNGAGVATVYAPDGTATSLVVTIPPSATNLNGANPTGIVGNSSAFFKITKNANTQPSVFIFVSEDGSISGWNPAVDPTNAIIAVDNGATGAVYKGAAIGVSGGHNFLYVSNFHTGKVEIYDENFARADTSTTFTDPNLPAGFAPFNLRNFNGQIFVTYAKQDASAQDDVPGVGNGFINVFDTAGTFVKRLVTMDRLNSPWGLAFISGTFGKFQNGLFVGNFGDGNINVYDATTGVFLGTPRGPLPDRTPLQFQGLWDLAFSSNTIFFTAGIADEAHGLFGVIFVGK